MEFRIPRMEFPIPRAAPRIPRNSPRVATPPTCYRSLSGPSGPKFPGNVPRGVSRALRAPAFGMSKKCPVFFPCECQKGVLVFLSDTFGTLLWTLQGFQGFGRAPKTPRGKSPGTLRARRARETPVAGRGGLVDFKKHPARKVGTRSRQCGPKVPGRLAFPGARNPSICSIWRFGKIFPAIFPEFSRELSSRTPAKTPETATAFSSFLREWPFHSESVFPEIGVVPRLLIIALIGVERACRVLGD